MILRSIGKSDRSEFYLPECWLKFGKGQRNVIVLGLRQTINGATIRAAEVLPYPDAAETIL